MSKVPFLDLRITDADERAELLAAVETVFDHGRFINGPEVAELERQVAARCQRPYAVGCNSGTDALILALRCLGLGPGDEVILPAMSWIATCNAVALTGATPVFADIRDDLTIDPASVRSLLTPATKALLPVHYTGKIADIHTLLAIAAEHGLELVEDAAQAFGATWQGRPAGSFGRFGCFSMNPMKVFAGLGEAGMVVCGSDDDRRRLEVLRYNGMVDREVCIQTSSNGRLDTLQAALLLKRLARVDTIIARRREIAQRYNAALSGMVETPREVPGQRDVCYVYAIRTPHRDALRDWLESQAIEAKVRDPYLMPDQPAYRDGVRGEFPNARRLVGTLLCLPAHEKMHDGEVDQVIDAVLRFFASEAR